MSEKLRLRATMIVEVEYEVDPAAYGTDDSQKIIEMEQMSFDQDPADLLGRDEAQHWVDVEDITNATTDQQVDDDMRHPGSHGVKPPLGFNIKGALTGRIQSGRTFRTIEQKPDGSVECTTEHKPNDRE